MKTSHRNVVLNSSPFDTVPLTFTRTGVAYDKNGLSVAENQARFEHRVPDVTVSNLLTGNQSDGGDTLNPELLTLNQRTGTDAIGTTAGFGTVKGSEVNTSSTEQAHSGTRSLKCVTAGSSAGEGEYHTATVVNGTSYICGQWVYASDGVSMMFGEGMTGQYTYFTGTGAWKWVEVPFTANGTVASIITKTTGTLATTFYVDSCRLGTNVTTGFSSGGVYCNGAGLTISPYQNYQGYRSLKVNCTGANAYEGVYFTATTVNGSNYTVNFQIYIPNGITLSIGQYGNKQNVTGTGEWYHFTQTFTANSATTYIIINTDSSKPVTAFYIDQVMVETGSVTHDWAYGGSSYSTYKTEYGCYIGETVTNGASANISTGGDTLGNTTGFLSVNGVENITYSTDEKIQGNGSIKVVVDGSNLSDGIKANLGVTANMPNTFQMWVKFEKGVPFRFEWNSSINYWTGTGDWQFIYSTQTPVSTPKPFYLKSLNPSGATFYIDLIQSTPTAYPLPQDWTLGGTTKSAETLTAPSSVLNIDTNGYSNLLTANQADCTETLGNTTGWGIAGTTSISSSTNSPLQGSKCLKAVTSDANNVFRYDNMAMTLGVSYTSTIYVRAPVGSTYIHKLWNETDSYWWGSSPIIGTGDWQECTVPFIAPRTGNFRHYVFQTGGTQGETGAFYADKAQLSATSTAKPWIPGGTQVNAGSGTIECEVILPVNTQNQALFSHRITTSNILQVTMMTSKILKTYIGDNVNYDTVDNGIIFTFPLSLKVCSRWDNTSYIITANGEVATQTIKTNPKLPQGYNTLYIGSGPGFQWLNGIIRNITISRPKREDSDVTNRSDKNTNGKGFKVDKNITLVAPLKNNLKAYRVRI